VILGIGDMNIKHRGWVLKERSLEKERVREREVGRQHRREDEKIRTEGNLYCKM
jgi:hypothetical protein